MRSERGDRSNLSLSDSVQTILRVSPIRGIGSPGGLRRAANPANRRSPLNTSRLWFEDRELAPDEHMPLEPPLLITPPA